MAGPSDMIFGENWVTLKELCHQRHFMFFDDG